MGHAPWNVALGQAQVLITTIVYTPTHGNISETLGGGAHPLLPHCTLKVEPFHTCNFMILLSFYYLST